MVGVWLSLSACYTSKIYVVRHAERLDQSADTPLSSAGLQRAQALADSLKNKNIDRIFGTKYQRNRQTAQVLCDVTGKGYEVYEPHPTEVIVKTVEKIGKQNVVIVGHSDTVLEIVKGFGVTPTKAKIESSDYDNLFVITVKKGVGGSRKTLEEKTYATERPSSPAPRPGRSAFASRCSATRTAKASRRPRREKARSTSGSSARPIPPRSRRSSRRTAGSRSCSRGSTTKPSARSWSVSAPTATSREAATRGCRGRRRTGRRCSRSWRGWAACSAPSCARRFRRSSTSRTTRRRRFPR